MKGEILLSIVLMSLTIGERQQRSTVLTDESKRVLEHFDFSNFDKQEALNYIDRQRHENQIRGKRSQLKTARDPKDENSVEVSGVSADEVLGNFQNQQELQTDVQYKNTERTDLASTTEGPTDHGKTLAAKAKEDSLRGKRGHRRKKKHRSKGPRHQSPSEGDYYYETEEDAERNHGGRRRKKKKKRHYWDHWSEWSPCSVTCGRGRKIRWRKCIAKNCITGEVEMGEKTCQLPACNLLTKLLGL